MTIPEQITIDTVCEDCDMLFSYKISTTVKCKRRFCPPCNLLRIKSRIYVFRAEIVENKPKLVNKCRACGKPLMRLGSQSHSGPCAALWNRMKKDNVDHVDPEYFKEQLVEGFAWDDVCQFV